MPNRVAFQIGLCACVAVSCFAQDPPVSVAAAERPGILLLAHGGRVSSWNEEVRRVADRVNPEIPTEVAFGMATRRTIQEGIDHLQTRGVTEIVAVPLFVSSHSSVIDSTAYLLGLRPHPPEDLKVFASMDHADSPAHHEQHNPAAAQTGMKPITATVPIRMTSALNSHPTVAAILLDRASSISVNPTQEKILLVAHGPESEDENRLWLRDMGRLADEMKAKSTYAGIEYMTVRDDASPKIRNAATKELRRRVKKIRNSRQTALVVPLLLSYGGIEDGIKKRLRGLDYKMPSQGLLPDNRIAHWVLEIARSTDAQP